MSYVDVFITQLEHFKTELAKDKNRLVSAGNELERLLKERVDLEGQLAKMKDTKKSELENLTALRERTEKDVTEMKMRADEKTREAHQLLEQARKANEEAENRRIQAEKTLEAVSREKAFWEGKTAALKAAIGN